MTYILKIFSAVKSCDEKVIAGHSCRGTIIKKKIRVGCEKELNSPDLLELLIKVSNNGFSVLIYLNSKKLHEVSLLKRINFSKLVTREKYPDVTTCLDSSCACGSEECLEVHS